MIKPPPTSPGINTAALKPLLWRTRRPRFRRPGPNYLGSAFLAQEPPTWRDCAGLVQRSPSSARAHVPQTLASYRMWWRVRRRHVLRCRSAVSLQRKRRRNYLRVRWARVPGGKDRKEVKR